MRSSVVQFEGLGFNSLFLSMSSKGGSEAPANTRILLSYGNYYDTWKVFLAFVPGNMRSVSSRKAATYCSPARVGHNLRPKKIQNNNNKKAL